MTRAAMTADQR
jgi:hypothetical protein